MKKVCMYFFYGFDSNEGLHRFGQNGEPLGWETRLHCELLNHGLQLEMKSVNKPDDSDYLLCYRPPELFTIFKWLIKRKMHRSVFSSLEPPVVLEIDSEDNLRLLSQLFGNVLFWNDDIVDEKRIFKISSPIGDGLSTSPPTAAFSDRKLLTNISGNKFTSDSNPCKARELYSERVRAIRFMEQNHPEDFDFYGIGWNSDEYPSYGGAVESKQATLEKYRFSVCFENMKDTKGYITEKIFDCFNANCVPIYWGASNIDEFIPPECYIDFRKFSGWEDVYQYIKNMPEDEFNNYIESKNRYAMSDAFKEFSYDYFIKRTIAALERVGSLEGEYSYSVAWRAFFRYALLDMKIHIHNIGRMAFAAKQKILKLLNKKRIST